MEEIVKNSQINESKQRNEASQKAMKAILALTVFTILVITYGVILFADNLQAL